MWKNKIPVFGVVLIVTLFLGGCLDETKGKYQPLQPEPKAENAIWEGAAAEQGTTTLIDDDINYASTGAPDSNLGVVTSIGETMPGPDLNLGAHLCNERAECSEWGGWLWEFCKGDGKGGGVQKAKRTRECRKGSVCQEEETQSRECEPVLDVGFRITVDGNNGNAFILGRKNEVVVTSERDLNLPISFTSTDGFVDKWKLRLDWKIKGREQCKNPKECTTDAYVDHLREILLYPDEIEIDIIVSDATGLKTKFRAPLRSEPPCTENWSCTAWAACTGNTQARTCTDANNCGTTASKPAESQSCQAPPPCTESWSCTEWGAWSEPGSCQENGTQAKSRTRTCTDANNCGTTSSKPSTSETTTQSCTYTPAEQKAEYSTHVSTLGNSMIGTLSYEGDSKTFDLAATQGTYGYKIPSIPAKATVKVCVTAGAALSLNYYPQYHNGFDWSDPSPGCTQIYNKNEWANGVLVHLGDPTPMNTAGTITVTKVN